MKHLVTMPGGFKIEHRPAIEIKLTPIPIIRKCPGCKGSSYSMMTNLEGNFECVYCFERRIA